MTRVLIILVCIAGALMAGPVLAADWVASKLRGVVMVYDLAAANRWVPLERGQAVSGTQLVRTLTSGRVEFVRGTETVDFGADTQGRIEDRANHQFTTVHQDFGTVTVDADVRKVKHFAVETPFLVAAVKGTRYVVVTTDGYSRVKVLRGLVGITDKIYGGSIVLPAGEEVVAGQGPMVVSGRPSGNVAAGEDVGLGAVVGTVGGTASDLTGVLDDTLEGAGGLVSDTLDVTGDTLSGTLDTAGSAVSGTLDTAGGLVGGTVGGLTTTLGGVLGH